MRNPIRIIGALLIAATLSACAALNANTPEPLPTIVLGSNTATSVPSRSKGGTATASGTVVPSQKAQLSFSLQERVKAVNVGVGDTVKAGQVLVELDDSLLQAQIRQAQAAVAAAQANYDLLAAGPTAEQLRQANATLLIATANYSRTVSGARPSDIAAAQAALTAASAAYAKLKAGPLPEEYAAAEAAYQNAQAALQQAQYAYDLAYKQNPAAIGASPESLALQQATNNATAAKAAYDLLAKGPDEAQLSAANQQVESARAALNAVTSPARDFDIAQAQAQIDQAQAALDALKAGAQAQQLDAARAQVDQAKAALDVLQEQAYKYNLVAPMNAVVLSRAIQPGETTVIGVPVILLGDLDHLRVETTDLSERDVPQITIGQAATVLVKALNQSVNGRVTQIAPQADTLGGDVVYKTTIELDTRPPGLRAGMSVDVQFGASTTQ